MNESQLLLKKLLAAQETREPLILGTVVSTTGSTYRKPGTRMLIDLQNNTYGLISGGCLESHAAELAQKVFASGEAELVTFDMTAPEDGLLGYGKGCQGRLDVLLERITPACLDAQTIQLLARRNLFSEPQSFVTIFAARNKAEMGTYRYCLSSHRIKHLHARPIDLERSEDLSLPIVAENSFQDMIPPNIHLLVYGAGQDVLPLVRFAEELNWVTTVIDHRAAFATRERFPGVDHIICEAPATSVAYARKHPRTAAVIMTHSYYVDLQLLPALLTMNLPYLGLLGPHKRREQLFNELIDQFSPTSEQLSRLYSPAGLRLGGDSPATFALSIIAEIQAVLSQSPGTPLRADRHAIIQQQENVI